ncbi:MAG: 3-deoxy-manno-octulosonate cytidylyltransferase [Candidatus Hydrogenedentota bacterium]|jgi:3-deoxy-manno-octulosonate cytidylyltransferase (CMP-KDO synthetase)|nr:MAG: 3-deoxy-manno-octulosonate cytidylyltransferase [Candidatus Hydrogenedentota bacterium]GIX43678.1 MAG: 3-deoxy-manno-octulosonate cytidylyltransferase [Candidatus Sumerlaea sp.]
MRVIGVIPSRYASVRLPAKPLVEIAGKPLVQWVWEAASRARSLNELLVATDDERIARVVEAFGGKAVMTPPECPSGTDRIACAVKDRAADVVVNIQGDEPLMAAENIDACVEALLADADAAVATPMVPLKSLDDFVVPHVVKVVYDARGYALYFSRAPIPDWSRLSASEREQAPRPMKHLGLYVYRRAALEAFVTMPPSRYELVEKLEQLRFLEAGYRIRMVEVAHDSIGVDTPEDAAAVSRLLQEEE